MTALPEAYFRAEVMEVSALSPVMRRVVLGGPGLADYVSCGASDEWFRLLVPHDPAAPAPLPVRVGQQWQFESPPPAPRWYTVRRWDAARHRLTVDIVIHADGLATRWAEQVQPGHEVVISQPHGRVRGLEAEWMLILADQTGIPAASRILEELPAKVPVHAILEAPYESATFQPASPADLKVCWVYNPYPDVIASPLSAAARSVELPAGRGFVWMAGESSCARDIRRYFRHELKWRSPSYDIVGYWRPQAEAYQRRYREVEDRVADIYERAQREGADTEEILDEVFAVMESRGL